MKALHRFTGLAVAALLACAAVSFPAAQPQAAPKPLSKADIVKLLKGDVSPKRVGDMVRTRGVDFQLTPDAEREIREAGGDDGLIQTIAAQGPQGTQQKQGQGGQGGGQPAAPPQVNQEEIAAFQAIQNELDPNNIIKLVNDFEKKFPTSRGLPQAYLKAASIYQQKGDLNHAAEYGEKSLKIAPDNPVALVLVASILPQPTSLQGSDLVKEKKLAEAEEDANKALKLIEQLPKQPNVSEEQWNEGKATLSSMAHSSLGMIHLQRSAMSLTGADLPELGKAEKEYMAAVSITKNVDPADYFRLGDVEERLGKLDEAVASFTKAGQFDQSGQIKALADQQIERIKKKKGGATPPAKP